MPNVQQRKSGFLNALVSYAAKAEVLTRDLAELVAFYGDNGFDTGPNAIVQTDIDQSSQPHLTPALVSSSITALGNVNLTAAQRTTLRQVASQVVPASL